MLHDTYGLILRAAIAPAVATTPTVAWTVARMRRVRALAVRDRGAVERLARSRHGPIQPERGDEGHARRVLPPYDGVRLPAQQEAYDGRYLRRRAGCPRRVLWACGW